MLLHRQETLIQIKETHNTSLRWEFKLGERRLLKIGEIRVWWKEWSYTIKGGFTQGDSISMIVIGALIRTQ